MSTMNAVHYPGAKFFLVSIAALSTLAGCGGSDSASTGDSIVTTTVDPGVAATTTNLEPDAPAETSAPAGPLGGYQPATVEGLAGGKSDPITSPLPDGTYWSWDYSSDGTTVEFTLSQFFGGDACREQFGESEDVCASDNDTLYEPAATVSMPGGQGSASVVMFDDSGSVSSYQVTQEEFARLVAGQAPASDAPSGYTFVPEGVIVIVRDGQAVSADQRFVA